MHILQQKIYIIYKYTGINNNKPNPKTVQERNDQRDPTRWPKTNEKCKTMDQKCEYIENAVKKGLIFALKPWQAGKASAKTMAKSWNFALLFYFGSQWNDEFEITKFGKINWPYVQCEICVKYIYQTS